MNRAGVSLVELVVAVVIVSVGVAGVASLTATAARTLVHARALDEAHVLLRSFVDSAGAGAGPESGRRTLHAGVLTWSVPTAPGSGAWARFQHVALPAPIQIEFIVPVAPGTP